MSHQSVRPRIPKIMNVATFHLQFGSDQACAEHLKQIRWGSRLERFACCNCGNRHGWWLDRRRLVECTECRRQTSVTSGTALHGTRTPLWKWFWAVYQMAQDKKGIAALELAKQVSISYVTAWLMLHKLRHAMQLRNQRTLLEGLVEIDNTTVGGAGSHAGQAKKTSVAVALELTAAGKPRRTAMATVPRVDRRALRRFASANIEAGSTLRTDRWGAKPASAKRRDRHHPDERSGGEARNFPGIHTFVGNMHRVLLGTHHCVSPKHLDGYLAEFVYRANRRWMEPDLFDRLIHAALGCKPLTYRQLVTGANRRLTGAGVLG